MVISSQTPKTAEMLMLSVAASLSASHSYVSLRMYNSTAFYRTALQLGILFDVSQQAMAHSVLSCHCSQVYLGMTNFGEYKHVNIALLGLATVLGLTELASTATAPKLVPKMLDDAVPLVMAV